MLLINSRIQLKQVIGGMAFALVILISGPSTATQTSLMSSNSKYAWVAQVYENLLNAIGDGRTPPKLILSQDKTKRITFYPQSSQRSHDAIEMGEGVLNLCLDMPSGHKEAVAFLLGHELAHFYKNHGWIGEFGLQAAGLPALSTAQLTIYEGQADLFGGFFSQMAGLGKPGIPEKITEAIYSYFNLSDPRPGYLPLKARIQLIKEAENKLRRLVPLFETANYMFVLNHHKPSTVVFQYIAQQFQSREILNNIGVSLLAQSIPLLSVEQQSFAYPFELDPETRLASPKVEFFGFDGGGGELDRLLSEAERFFKQAQLRDPNYLPSFINEATTWLLKGNVDYAWAISQRALAMAQQKDDSHAAADSKIIMGIAVMMKGNPGKARELFLEAKPGNSIYAELNLKVGNQQPADARPVKRMAPKNELIDERSLNDLARKDSIEYFNEGELTISIIEGDSWRAYDVVNKSKRHLFAATKSDYKGKTALGIGIGSSLSEVTERYGAPNRNINLTFGHFLVFENSKIVFKIGADDKVGQWLVFK